MDWRETAANKIKRMPPEALEVRKRAEGSLYTFALLVNPSYVYGEVHREAFKWLEDYNLYGRSSDDKTANKLLMFPRGHLKSHLMAVWVAWVITNHPEITVLYLSATAELAEIQLYTVKEILSSALYQKYWPEYINPRDGARAKWTERKIIIDHERRRSEGVRDSTVATAGLTTNTTGWHADIIIADDLVIPENAYTEDGRSSVRKKSSQFTSIRNAGGFTLACGTRYHPSDIYDSWKQQSYEVYDEDGNVVDKKPVWEVMERVVETDNQFLWPRTVRQDGKAFGFNMNELSRIRAEYEDMSQYYAQYYNNPNESSSNRIQRSKFQYYDERHIRYVNGRWCFRESPINIYASIDFAFSLNRKADYTAIVVIGVDPDGYIYVLDIDRFRTDSISEYFKRIAALHSKWSFKKMRAEVTVAQQIIVNDIKDHVKRNGMKIAIDEFRPTGNMGSKDQRIRAILETRYENMEIYHHRGGYTPVLEDELVSARPPHDDVKDALANAVEIAVKPHRRSSPQDLGMLDQADNRRFRFGGR